MTNALRDENRVPVMLGVSSTDPTVTLPIKIDSVTGKMLTESSTPVGLTIIDIKNANYSANAFEYVPCDISGGGFALTLPSAPADGTIIEAKIIKIDTNSVLEVKTSGADVFNIAGGNTSIYYNLLNTVAHFVYKSTTKIWYVETTAPPSAFAMQFPGIDAQTPITNTDVSLNTTTRVLTITPPLGYFYINIDGNGKNTRIRKTGTVTFPAFTDTSGMWYFYLNSAGTPVTTQTAWEVTDFNTKVPIWRVLWNATLYNFTVSSANVNEGDTYTNNGQTFTVRQTATGTTTVQMVGTGAPSVSGNLVRATGTGTDPLVFSAVDSSSMRAVSQYIECHLNTIDADTHQWFHLQGAQWEKGFVMKNNALVSGDPNADGRNTVVALTTGINMDDNLDYTVTNDSTPTNPWEQDLGEITPASLNATNSALFRVFRQRADGTITFRIATRFPFDWSIATNIPQYLTSTGVRTPVTNQRFMVNFIYATQNPTVGDALVVVSATQDFTSLANARAYNWVDIQNTYTHFQDGEIRPLYRLIHEVHTSTPNVYDVGAKYSVLRETQDLRKAAVTSTTTASGSLPASSVTVVPAGTISSTNVQSALEELDTEKVPTTRNLTINGTTYDLSADRTWTIATGLTWSEVTADGNLVADTGTLANKGTLLTLTLPTTCAVGKTIRVAGMNAGLWKIAQNAGQYVKFGNQTTTTGATGYLASVLTYDAVELVCIVADTGFVAVSSVGNITVA